MNEWIENTGVKPDYIGPIEIRFDNEDEVDCGYVSSVDDLIWRVWGSGGNITHWRPAPVPVNEPRGATLPVSLITPLAIAPTRATPGSAGYDLYALEDTDIRYGAFTAVRTGIAAAIPPHHYGQIAPRSGLAIKNGVIVGAGVIDSDYRGEILVALATLNGVYSIKAGDRIAQLLVKPIATPPVVLVENLDDTTRGAGGFGSTGK